MLDPSDFRDIVSGKRRGLLAGVARGLLGCVEIPYRTAMGIRNRRYDRQHSRVTNVGVPVISVGNLTLGGTGKTPMVCWLANWFRRHGVRVSIVSRGYGSKEGGQNDESMELEARLPDVPHLQNADRVAAANVAIDELATQLIILDDGFQHRRIGRDLDVLLVDATEPFGHEHVFPRGTLREPLAGARRANVIGLTRSSLVAPEVRHEIRARYKAVSPDAAWLELDHQPSTLLQANGTHLHLSELRDKSRGAFCGIGNPNAFRQTLAHAGLEPSAFREFPDHHNYDRTDIESLAAWARDSNVEHIVCTHKDLVKINVDQLGGVGLSALLIEIVICEQQDALDAQLSKILDSIQRDDNV